MIYIFQTHGLTNTKCLDLFFELWLLAHVIPITSQGCFLFSAWSVRNNSQMGGRVHMRSNLPPTSSIQLNSLKWWLTNTVECMTCQISSFANLLLIVRLIKKLLIIMFITSNNRSTIKHWLSGVNRATEGGGKSIDIC